MKARLTKFLIYLLGTLVGAVLGGVITYLILLVVMPDETERALISIIIFAIISSQFGMILGGPLFIRLYENRR